MQVDLGKETDFKACILSIKEQFGMEPAVLQFPYYSSDGRLDGILDVLNGRIHLENQECLPRYYIWHLHELAN